MSAASLLRDRLLAVMQHDVRRLDRLISDISDASRLDAELSRHEAQPLDLAALARAVVSAAEDASSGAGVGVTLSVQKPPPGSPKAAFRVGGHDSRLAQVLTNLIDNARSFSSPGDEVKVILCRKARRDEDGRILTMVGDRRRGRGPGHFAAGARAHLRTLLYRPPGAALRQQFRTGSCPFHGARSSRRMACAAVGGKPLRPRRSASRARGRFDALRRRRAGFTVSAARARALIWRPGKVHASANVVIGESGGAASRRFGLPASR